MRPVLSRQDVQDVGKFRHTQKSLCKVEKVNDERARCPVLFRDRMSKVHFYALPSDTNLGSAVKPSVLLSLM